MRAAAKDEHALEVTDAAGARGEARGGARGAQMFSCYLCGRLHFEDSHTLRSASCVAEAVAVAKTEAVTDAVETAPCAYSA